jgi:hypothetical protein
MPQQNWVAPVNVNDYSSGAAGTTLATAATLAISPSTATTTPDYVLPGGVAYVGMMLEIEAAGIWTCGATATNATFALMVGGTAGTVLCTTGALAMLASQTTVSWSLRALVTFRNVGTVGKVWTQGFVTGITAVAPSTVSRMDSGVFGTPAVVTWNTTAAQAIVLNGTLSQVTNSPTITCEQWLIKQVG